MPGCCKWRRLHPNQLAATDIAGPCAASSHLSKLTCCHVPAAAPGSPAWQLLQPLVQQYGHHALAHSMLHNPEFCHFYVPGKGSLVFCRIHDYDRWGQCVSRPCTALPARHAEGLLLVMPGRCHAHGMLCCPDWLNTSECTPCCPCESANHTSKSSHPGHGFLAAVSPLVCLSFPPLHILLHCCPFPTLSPAHPPTPHTHQVYCGGRG